MTCNFNNKWSETIEACKEQEPWTRPDITCRVFYLKLNELKHDLFINDVLGIIISHIYVIEFQKRGLPHAHLLLILKECDKPRNADMYDKIICAESPDPKILPNLYAAVTTHMIHGPCGHLNPKCVCMNKDTKQCSKLFPKRFSNTTTDDSDSFATYIRRSPEAGGHTFHNVNTNVTLDNQWVVPHNPYLQLKYNCHINVEIRNSISSVKYLYKFVYKGESFFTGDKIFHHTISIFVIS